LRQKGNAYQILAVCQRRRKNTGLLEKEDGGTRSKKEVGGSGRNCVSVLTRKSLNAVQADERQSITSPQEKQKKGGK